MAIQSANPPELHTWGAWRGLNQQALRGSIDDDEEYWNENLFAIGPGNLRSLWGVLQNPDGTRKNIYTAPSGKLILRIFFGFIGDVTTAFGVPPPGQYGWMFLSDGTIDQVDLSTSAVKHIGTSGAPVWQPVGPQYWASAKVWRPRFSGNPNLTGQQGGVLFGSPLGLFAWDGTTLSRPGNPAPDWLTNALEVSPGVPFTMPTGLPGIFAMEVYQSRLFVAGKDVIQFSAPGNGADFSTTDGGGAFGYFGDRLTYTYTDLAESAGYLYVFGDSSIDLISNVQLAGSGTPESPFTTSLSYQNTDPQIGQRFPRPVGRIGRYMQMWNGAGIFEIRGGEATEIGQKTTNVFNTLVLPKTAADTTTAPYLYFPTMAPATIFGFRVLLCNGRFVDPYGIVRNLILMWHPPGRDQAGAGFWSIASQNVELTNIGSYEQDSVITPFGTDGTHLFQLFASPDPLLPKILATKYIRGGGLEQLTIKNWKRLFLEFFDNSGLGVEFTGSFSTIGGGIPNGVQDIGFALREEKLPVVSPPSSPLADIFFIIKPQRGSTTEPQAISGMGIAGGVDMRSLSPDFTIERLHILTEQRTLWGA